VKIAIVCRGSYTFLKPLVEHWEKKGYIIVGTLNGADVIFVEWGNEQSVNVIQESKRKNVVIRVHGSEYFQDFHKQWDKEKIHSVIKANPAYTIPGVNVIDCGIPIDSDLWSPINGITRDDRRLLMVGSFVYSKNHIGLLHILSERSDYFKKIIFVGDKNATDNPYRYSETRKTLTQIDYYKSKYNLPVRIMDKMPLDELRELYTSCGYVVSNSINEGFHLTISEGILCGCKPLIYDWLGAKEIYGFETYHNTKSFWDMVDNYPYKTQTYLKNTILNKFGKDKIFETIDNALFEAAREWL